MDEHDANELDLNERQVNRVDPSELEVSDPRDADMVDSPSVPAMQGDQQGLLRDDQQDVLDLWLSSIRSTYRRSVRGRTSLMPFQSRSQAPRHRAAL